jgi:hypothetical protein
MASKRKRVVLTVKDEVVIVSRLKEGEWGENLAEECGVGSVTMWDIKISAELILIFFRTCRRRWQFYRTNCEKG